jgi:glycosyltransferase involved in cell wall biosynthesis
MIVADTIPPVAGDAARAQITITVILTNYNHSRYLRESLDAICAQTRPADQIVVIDDGSTDDSLATIRSFAALEPNMLVLENGTNRGVQASIARALGAAAGDYVVWAAADDILMPRFLERGEMLLREHPEAGLVFSRLATFIDGTGEERHYKGDEESLIAFNLGREPTYLDPPAFMKRLETSYLWMSGNTVIANRRKLLEVGAFIPELEWHSDWFAFYAVALRNGACTVPETLAMMRVLPETYSSSGMRSPKRQRAVLGAILDVFGRPENQDLRRKIVARPCILSPFGRQMLRVLSTRPQDFDVFLRYLTWHADRRVLSLRGQLAASKKHGLVLWTKFAATRALVCLLLGVTPSHWRQ